MAPTKAYLLLALGMALHGVQGANSTNETCTTAACVLAAAGIIQDMDLQADPCVDFNAYVCGGFMDRMDIPPDMGSISALDVLVQENNRFVRSVADVNSTNPPQMPSNDIVSTRNLKKVQDLYSSCMNAQQIASVGRKPLVDQLNILANTFNVSNSDLNPQAGGNGTSGNGNGTTTTSSTLTTMAAQATSTASSTVTAVTTTKAPAGNSTTPGNSTSPSAGNSSTVDPNALAATLVLFNMKGLDVFNVFTVGPNASQPTTNTLILMPGGLGLPSKDLYLDNGTMAIYQKTIGKMFAIMYAPGPLNGTAPSNGTTPSSGTSTTTSSTSSSQAAAPTTSVTTTTSATATSSVTTVHTTTVAQPASLAMVPNSLGMLVNGSTNATQHWALVAESVADFEKDLAAASTDIGSTTNPSNSTTVGQLTTLTPSVNWTLALNQILGSSVNSTYPIVVNSPAYQKNLQALLQKTPPNVLQDYFAWTMIRQLAPSLAPLYNRPLNDLQANITGASTTVAPDRWQECVSAVNNNLDQMIGPFYVNDMFAIGSTALVESIVQSVQTSYVNVIPTLPWLNGTDAQAAAKSISNIVGYSSSSPNVTSPQSLSDFYKGYTVDPNDFFGNQMRASAWAANNTLSQLNQTVNNNTMLVAPQSVDAHYDNLRNQIVLPAGILQQPFCAVTNPDYMNFGAIGSVIGREIAHGVTSVTANTTTTNSTTMQTLQNMTQCFVEQYNNFTVLGQGGTSYNVNGSTTLSGNIGDNVGFNQSYAAWLTRYNNNTNNSTNGTTNINFELPGLNLTAQQLFFVSYARIMCSNSNPAALSQQIIQGTTTPAKYRINGVVQNSAEFAQAFQCNASAPMNPKNKCLF
ncbi:hypothetical protein EDD21DRAFT_378151 [Dissophora ornata]|nr:hypothetical protein BGZ58_005818 [Dissophora ornata]KAI8600076.1 hypothetical protein EDD21DRAFT_378151 [Dissophora ornata]